MIYSVRRKKKELPIRSEPESTDGWKQLVVLHKTITHLEPKIILINVISQGTKITDLHRQNPLSAIELIYNIYLTHFFYISLYKDRSVSLCTICTMTHFQVLLVLGLNTVGLFFLNTAVALMTCSKQMHNKHVCHWVFMFFLRCILK